MNEIIKDHFGNILQLEDEVATVFGFEHFIRTGIIVNLDPLASISINGGIIEIINATTGDRVQTHSTNVVKNTIKIAKKEDKTCYNCIDKDSVGNYNLEPISCKTCDENHSHWKPGG